MVRVRPSAHTVGGRSIPTLLLDPGASLTPEKRRETWKRVKASLDEKSWYCNRCKVEVIKGTRCPYCGKTSREAA